MVNEDRPQTIRLDVWLDIACVFKTRSEAQKALKAGKIEVNGQPVKPNRQIKPGDELEIGRPFGRTQRLKVLALADRHVAKKEARQLYEDLTPPPSADEIEMRRQERLYRAAVTPLKTPDRRARKALRRARGKD